jgi:sulfur dioxygenase
LWHRGSNRSPLPSPLKPRQSSRRDAGEQYDAITRKLFTLPDETKVFPAHDYRGNACSTIGEEKRLSSRIAGRSREAYIALMNNLGMPLPEKIQEALQANVSAIDDDSVKFPSYAQLTQTRQLTPVPSQNLVHASGNANRSAVTGES